MTRIMTLEFENESGDIRSVSTLDRAKTVRAQPVVTGDVAPFFSLAGAPTDWQVSVSGQ